MAGSTRHVKMNMKRQRIIQNFITASSFNQHDGKMYAENYKRFELLIDKLREFDGVIIVEGVRDRVALRNLGVRAEIIRLSRLPLAEIALIASQHHDVMILTDLDREGEELAKKLTRYLEGYRCRVDTETRRELRRIARKDIKGIEDLYGLYLKLRF